MNLMKFINLNKFENTYWSNWAYNNDTIFIKGTIEPFTYWAEYKDEETEEVSMLLISESEINLVKSKL